MAALTAPQLAWLAGELGDHDAADLQARHDRLESVRDVAIEVVKGRRNDWLASPLSANVSGVAALNATENVKALERQLATLAQLDDDPSDDPVPPSNDGTTVAGRDLGVYTLVRARRR